MSRSLFSSRRGWLKSAGGVAAGAALGGVGLTPRRARADGAATIYPIDDWRKAQGTFCAPNPNPKGPPAQCPPGYLFIPPSRNFADWFSRFATLHNAPTPPIYVATVDYAMLENNAFGNAFGTTIDQTNSKAIVQPFSDGSANVSVRVLLYTHNANTWVIPLTVVNGQPQPDFSTQLVNNQVLFGFRPYPDASVPPVGVCLGDSFLDITYITTSDNLWVDLDVFLTSPGLQSANFRSQATGPFTPYYLAINGLPQGTQGRCTVSQTGLIAKSSTANPNSRVFLDGFPAELIDLHPLG